MEENNSSNMLGEVWLIFLVASLMVVSLFEIGILVYGFINADRVECNLLWCTFISEESSYSIDYKYNSLCFVNGKEVNCSDFPGDEHFCFNGVCEMNGVCGGNYSSVLECIKNYTERQIRKGEGLN